MSVISGESVGGIFVLREKSGRGGDTKRFDIIRLAEGTNIDEILVGLPQGQYKVVDTNQLASYEVEYVTVQKNSPVR